MNFTHLLLQAASTPAPQQGGGNSMIMNVLFIGLLIIVFYFFMIRPQQKKQKEVQNFLGEINKGTKVVTIGGIVGKVLEVRNKTFMIEVEGGTRLQILKEAISLENSRKLNQESDDKEKKD